MNPLLYTLLTELYKVYAAVQLTDSYREIQLKQNLSVDIKILLTIRKPWIL